MKGIKRVICIILALAFTFSFSIKTRADEGSVTNVKQTGAVNGKSITWTWDKYPGAVSYDVIIYDGSTYSDPVQTTANSYTLNVSGLSKGYAILVKVNTALGATNISGTAVGYTAPVVPNTITVWEWIAGSASVDLRWYGVKADSYYVPDGYDVKITTLAGKKIKTYKNVKSNCSSYGEYKYVQSFKKTIKKAKNAGFKISVRSYKTLDSGKKIYSKWSKAKAFVPGAKLKKGEATSYSTGRLYWNKVKNAQSYTIYRMTGTDTYKKVKKVSGSTLSAELPKSYFYNGLFVTADVKVKGKKYKSTVLKQVNIKYIKYH